MTLAVVAPAAPAIPWALFALSSAIAFIVSWGLLHGWGATFGRLFQWLGNKGLDITLKAAPDIHIHPFRFLLSLDQQVRHGLSVAVAATEHAMVTSFHRMVGIIIWSAQETAGLAQDIYDAIRGAKTTVTTTITKTLDAKTAALVKSLKASVSTLAHVTVPHLAARVRALEHAPVHVVKAVAGTIANPFPRIKTVEHDLSGLRKRVKSLEKQLAIGVGAALLVRSLAKLGLGWLRCGNVNKAGKSICRMNPGVLETLLLDAALLTVSFNLEDFAKEMQAVTSEAASLIHDWST